MMYSAAAFMMSTGLVVKNVYYFTSIESWIPSITGFVLSLIIIYMYITVANRFPGYSLIEINEAVFGRIIGKIISFLYIFYFFSLSSFNTRVIGNFVSSSLLPNTPITVLFILFIFVCSLAVRKGPINLMRYGFIFALICITAILFNTLLLTNIINLKNFLPFFQLPIKNYLIGTQIITMLPNCELLVFIMLNPYIQKSKGFSKALIGGLIIGSITNLVVVLRDVAVLGGYINLAANTANSVIRLINVGDILTRLEIVYAAILISMTFFKISILFFVTVSGLSRLFKLQSCKILVSIVGVLIIIYASAFFVSEAEHVQWLFTVAATYSTFFILILPLVTLIVLPLRGNNKKLQTKP